MLQWQVLPQPLRDDGQPEITLIFEVKFNPTLENLCSYINKTMTNSPSGY